MEITYFDIRLMPHFQMQVLSSFIGKYLSKEALCCLSILEVMIKSGS